MATLNFSLPEDLKAWITAQVAAGGYGNTSEYIRELVRLDRKRKSEDRLDALLLEGLEKLDAGKGVELTPARIAALRNASDKLLVVATRPPGAGTGAEAPEPVKHEGGAAEFAFEDGAAGDDGKEAAVDPDETDARR